jgi:hypothetical protein
MRREPSRSPCGLHLFPRKVAKCVYCEQLLRELREMPRVVKKPQGHSGNQGAVLFRKRRAT